MCKHVELYISCVLEERLALKRAFCLLEKVIFLTSESVQSTSLTFQSIDDVHGSDSLSLGMLGVGDGITDNVLEEHLENTTCLLVDEARDTFHSTTTSQTSDGRLGDTLDVISQHLPVTLGATLSESLSSFTTSRHVDATMLVGRMPTTARHTLLCYSGVKSATRATTPPTRVASKLTETARLPLYKQVPYAG